MLRNKVQAQASIQIGLLLAVKPTPAFASYRITSITKHHPTLCYR